MNKPYLRVELTTKNEHSLIIQEGAGKAEIEIFFKEGDEKESGVFYIEKSELPAIIEKLQEVMNYTDK